MDKNKSPEVLEFTALMQAIRTDMTLLKNVVLSEEELIEENQLLGDLNEAIQAQVFSTLNNLVIYQVRGWRELID